MIKYTVNKEAGIVIAKFDTTKIVGTTRRDYAYWKAHLNYYVEHLVLNTVFEYQFPVMTVTEHVLEGRKLVGISKVHPHDTFSEIRGKELARLDLIARFNKAKEQAREEVIKLIKHDVNLVMDRH